MSWALYGDHGKDLDPTSILVLVVLADHAGTDGIAWPSWSTIGRGARCSRATVHRRLVELTDARLVTPAAPEWCPAAWQNIPANTRPVAYRLALPGSQAETSRGLRNGTQGSQEPGLGVSAVRPKPKQPNQLRARDSDTPTAGLPAFQPFDAQERYSEQAAARHVDHAAGAARARAALKESRHA